MKQDIEKYELWIYPCKLYDDGTLQTFETKEECIEAARKCGGECFGHRIINYRTNKLLCDETYSVETGELLKKYV